MGVLEVIPWLISIVVLASMARLANSAFRGGEQAGHHESAPPRPATPPAPSAGARSGESTDE